MVSNAAVSSEVSKAAKIAERQVVDANAQTVAEVRLSQRSDIQRARRVTMALLDELERQAGPDNAALLDALGELRAR